MKKQQQEWRTEMYQLMMTDEYWYKKEQTDTYKRITELGQLLTKHSEDKRKRYIDKEEYLCLVEKGMMFKDICTHLGVSKSKLMSWRKANDLF